MGQEFRKLNLIALEYLVFSLTSTSKTSQKALHIRKLPLNSGIDISGSTLESVGVLTVMVLGGEGGGGGERAAAAAAAVAISASSLSPFFRLILAIKNSTLSFAFWFVELMVYAESISSSCSSSLKQVQDLFVL